MSAHCRPTSSAMQTETFKGSGGEYCVAVTKLSGIVPRERLWLAGVGLYLRGLKPNVPIDVIHKEYVAAAVGTRSLKALQAAVKRVFDDRPHGIACTTTFVSTGDASAEPKPHSDRWSNQKRDHSRGYRQALEAHYQVISLFIGTLFNSLRDFRLANSVLSMESADARDHAGHRRRHRLKYSGISFPHFSNLDRWSNNLVSWASERMSMGTLVRTPHMLLDRLTEVVQRILDEQCGDVTLPSSHSLDFLFWLDGTSSGLRSVSVVKFRLIDTTRILFQKGFSEVTCWMDALCGETDIPLEYQVMMMNELSRLWTSDLTVAHEPVKMRFLLLMADHKQLDVLCGVQGYSTSQRCAICTLPAQMFCRNAFGGTPRAFQETAIDAVAAAREILMDPSTVPAIRRKYNNVADMPFAMLTDTSIPLDHVFAVPGTMHNCGGILETTFEWLRDSIRSPRNTPRTVTVAIAQLHLNLKRTSGLHPKNKRWNHTQYRLAFSQWRQVFHDLLPDHYIPVPFMASVISFILYSPQATPTPSRCTTLLAYSFLLPLLMGWDSSNLYWHSTLHLVPILLRMKMPASVLSEESFESEFRPSKRILRNRSNNRLGKDLLMIRALCKAKTVIRSQWGSKAHTQREWGCEVSMGVVLGPCMMAGEALLANLPGLLQAVRNINPDLITTVHVNGAECLHLSCGDVADSIVLCLCGEHANAQYSQSTPGFTCASAAVDAARHNQWDTSTAVEPASVEWESSDNESTASGERDESEDSEERANRESSSSDWSPRSYYGSVDADASSGSDDEPIAKRLRPLWLGEFWSEPTDNTDEKRDEPEFVFPE